MFHIHMHVNIRRILSLSFALLLVVGALPPAIAVQSGICGDRLEWNFSDGTLTIAGEGAMEDYSADSPAPWYEFRGEIRSLNLSQEISKLGDYAFSECSELERVSIPDSVEQIGEKAFYGCTGIKMLSLGKGLKFIGERAFERCWSLPSLILPQGLEEIGDAAFWRCHKLTAVSVPSSVIKMGSSIFAYCDGLLHADVQAQIDQLPFWTFYGCDNLSAVTLSDQISGVGEYAFTSCENLSTVRYQGSRSNAEKIGQDISDYLDTFESYMVVATIGNSGTSAEFTGDEDNAIIHTNSVIQTENATVSTEVISGGEMDGDIQINGVIENEKGWQDVVEQTEEILEQYRNPASDIKENVKVEVSILDGSSLSGDQMSMLVGKPIDLTVHTMVGESWTVDLSTMSSQTMSDTYDLSYILSTADEVDIDAERWYGLDFNADTQINAEILIRLPESEARKIGTLYYQKNGKWMDVQSVVVDDDGYAHFYLANVDEKTEYLIGMNVPSRGESEPIVPKNMRNEFDITDTLAPMDYVITGRKSSWGMEIGQVTWIMIGVLGGSVVLIGVVLYLMNKRKLKKGYVVDLDEYELN